MNFVIFAFILVRFSGKNLNCLIYFFILSIPLLSVGGLDNCFLQVHSFQPNICYLNYQEQTIREREKEGWENQNYIGKKLTDRGRKKKV